MDIKVQETGIYKRIPKELKSSPQLEDLLNDCFESQSENRIFSHFAAANGYYIWSLPGKSWMQLSKATPDQQELVRCQLDIRKGEIKTVLKNRPDLGLTGDMIEKVLSVPSDDFVYYRYDDYGKLEIKLVAWDYQLPAVQVIAKGDFRSKGDVPKQSVVLKFIEAGKPVPDYTFLVRSVGGRFVEKKTDEQGAFSMPALIVGSKIDICSNDHTRDFSFVVKAGEGERICDLTGSVNLRISAVMDGDPYSEKPVKVLYGGDEMLLTLSSNGSVTREISYFPGAEVIAELDGENQALKVEYPVTEIRFEKHSPMSEILVYSILDGRPSRGDLVTINIAGYDSFSRTTDSDGCVEERVLLRSDATVSVSLGGEVKSNYPMQQANVFRFERETYEPVQMPDPTPEHYNVFLRCNNGPFPSGYSVAIYQNSRKIDLQPDSDGKCLVDKSIVECGKPATVIFNDSSRELGRMDVTFTEQEDDYELNLNLKTKYYPWDIIKQILVALLVTLIFLFALLTLALLLTW